MSAKRIITFGIMVSLLTLCSLISCSLEEPELGSEENPIIWAFVPSAEIEQIVAGAQEMADLLHDETALYFKIKVATDYFGVIDALSSDPLEAHMSALSTFSYILAAARGCAEAVLVSIRSGSDTYNGQIMAHANSGINNISDLAGKSFCRPDPLSTSGWIVPMLTMRAAGINPEVDLGEIVDVGSHNAVVISIYNGEYDAGATYADARPGVQEDYPDVIEKVIVIEVTVDIPNDGVQFHPSVPQHLREKIVQGLLAIAETEEGKEAMNIIYGWTGLVEHDDAFYDPFREVLEASGLSIEELLLISKSVRDLYGYCASSSGCNCHHSSRSNERKVPFS